MFWVFFFPLLWTRWLDSKNWLLKVTGYSMATMYTGMFLFGLAQCTGLVNGSQP